VSVGFQLCDDTKGPRGKNDLLEPGVLRSLCNINAVKVLTGPSANYAMILDSESLSRQRC
jgi:hypothetical protein